MFGEETVLGITLLMTDHAKTEFLTPRKTYMTSKPQTIDYQSTESQRFGLDRKIELVCLIVHGRNSGLFGRR